MADMEVNAQRKLGMKPDEILAKPKDGQNVAEWLRENGGMFGVPEEADKYELTRPDAFKDDDKAWNADLETQARALAHEHGVSQPALQAFTELYAGSISKIVADAEQELDSAKLEMNSALQDAWGAQFNRKMTLAKQGAQFAAEQAGLDNKALSGISQLMAKETGDANTVRLFSAIGEMLSEDQLTTLNTQGGTLTTTPEQARAELDTMKAPGGEYEQAVAKNDRATLDRLKPKMEQLSRLAAQ
ncbi:MAG: hypothetical protein AAFU41_00825 [Pseudomonadota bacterium]